MRTEEEIQARIKQLQDALKALNKANGPFTIRQQMEMIIEELQLVVNKKNHETF